jgi:hypothetical protein
MKPRQSGHHDSAFYAEDRLADARAGEFLNEPLPSGLADTS